MSQCVLFSAVEQLGCCGEDVEICTQALDETNPRINVNGVGTRGPEGRRRDIWLYPR